MRVFLAAVFIIMLAVPGYSAEGFSDAYGDALREADRANQAYIDYNREQEDRRVRQRMEQRQNRQEYFPPLFPTQCTWLEINYKWVQVCR